MSVPTILTVVGTKVRLVTQYEFLTEGMEGTILETGWTNAADGEDPQRTLIIDMGQGTIELDHEHFDLFEVVKEEKTADPVRLVEPK